jgi:signal transduction protein with GAF and PtsI domain
MAYADLEQARKHHAALKLILGRCGGDAADLRALARVVELCRGASEAVDDEYCREKMRVVMEFAAELLAHGDHRKWSRDAVPGVDFLRQQIMNALELLHSRFYSLELARRATAPRISSGPQALQPLR